MIFLKPTPATTLEDLKARLQQAVELEHSTIPPYLLANFTLFDGGGSAGVNSKISEVISSVLFEEMLHMSIACNVLNAVGGQPCINKPEFIPNYPCHLPGAVEGSLVVHLEKFSLDLVQKTFMEIERPEKPVPTQDRATEGETIGQFYMKIIELIKTLEKEAQKDKKTIFTGNSALQMTIPQFYSLQVLFPVIDLDSAVRALGIIIDQGEGTSTDPFVDSHSDDEGPDEIAHYYRFEGIVKGRELVAVKDPVTGKTTYSFTGSPIPFDSTLVTNMLPDPSMSQILPTSLEYEDMRLFNYNYTSLLKCLHKTFNGQPQQIQTAFGLMFSLRLYALKLLVPLKYNCQTAGNRPQL